MSERAIARDSVTGGSIDEPAENPGTPESNASGAPESGAIFAQGMLLGGACALVLSVPSVVRAADQGLAALCVSAGALGLAAPLAGALRVLRRRESVRSLLWAASFALGPSCLLAYALKTVTHHRPLGAATFAVATGLLLLGSWALLARLGQLEKGERRTTRRIAKLAKLALSAGSMLVALRAVFDLVSSAAGRWGLVELAVLIGAGSVGATLRAPMWAARLGLGVWVGAMLIGGVLSVTLDPQWSSSPVLLLPFAWALR